MENNNLERVQYDYFNNTSSYIKMILDMLPESRVSIPKKQVIIELYNYFLNRFDEEKINEIARVSSMFREKVSMCSVEETVEFVDFISKNYLNKIVFDSANREHIFDVMNEVVKVYVDYYLQYQRGNINNYGNVQNYNFAR